MEHFYTFTSNKLQKIYIFIAPPLLRLRSKAKKEMRRRRLTSGLTDETKGHLAAFNPGL